MKRIKTIVMLLALLASGLISRAAPAYRTDTNPALLYWEAIQFLPAYNQMDSEMLDACQGAPMDEEYATLAQKYRLSLVFVRRAAQLKNPCDWGIDLADGPDTLLPHLAKVKAIAKAARFRTRYFLENGQEKEAVQDLIGAFVMARRASTDGTLIALLVQYACENLVISAVAENFHSFSPESLKQIQEAIDASPAPGTISGCIGGAERSCKTWFIDRLEEFQTQYPDKTKRMVEIRKWISGWLNEDGDGPKAQAKEDKISKVDRLIQSAGGTSEGLIALMKELEPLYIELQKINELPYDRYDAASNEFADKVKKSNNEIAKMFFPALEKSRWKEFVMQGNREVLRAAIQYRLNGEAAFKKIQDPYGNGPFGFRRFIYEKVDRGFELTSKYAGEKPVKIIFVEKAGPPFEVLGEKAGQPAKEL